MHLGSLFPGVALPQVCQIHIIIIKSQLLPGHLAGHHSWLPSLAHVRLDSIISVILLLQLLKPLQGLRPLQADPFLLEPLEAVPNALDVLLPLLQHLGIETHLGWAV